MKRLARGAAWSVLLLALAPEARAWPVPGGDAARSRIVQGTAGLKAPAVRWRRQIGDRAPEGTVLAADVNGDGTVELVTTRGGRVDVFGLDGRLGWSTPPLGVDRIGGLFDFDGDGRREVLAQSARGVQIVDATTGRLRWASPEGRYERVGAVLVGDVDGDRLPDLFVAETSCGASRRGPAHVYGFAGGFDGERQRAEIGAPRSYWCGLWHTLADLDGDGLPEVVVPDRDQFRAFDPRTGAQAFAGDDLEPEPNHVAPHRNVDVLPEGDGGRADEILAIVDTGFGDDARRELMLLDVADRGDSRRLAPVWRAPLPAAVELDAERAEVVRVGDEATLLISVYEGEGWSLRFVDAATGEERRRVPDARLLGAVDVDGDGVPELVTRDGDARAPAVFGRVALRGFDGAERWAVDRARALSRSRLPAEVGVSSERDALRTVATPEGPRLALLRDDDGDEAADALEIYDAGGDAAARRALTGTPGVVPRDGALDGLPLVLSLADGELAAFDAGLNLVIDADGNGVPDVAAPSGLAKVIAADVLGDGTPDPIVLTPSGRLLVLDDEGMPVWTRRLRAGSEHPQAGQLVPGGALEIVAPDGRTAGELGWVMLDGATGEPRWRHGLSSSDYRQLGAVVLADLNADGADDVVRLEQRRADDFLVVTALSGPDGRVLWQNTFARAGDSWVGRGLTAISVPEGTLRLLLADSASLHVIDAATGGIRGSATTVNAGGRVQQTGGDPPLARTGANGPIELLDEDLRVVWTAPEEGPNRAWLNQVATVVGGDEVWAVPGGGQPLVRYRLQDGTVIDRVGLANGALQTPPFTNLADPGFVTAIDDLFGQSTPGALVAAGDGFLYAFAANGTLRWQLPLLAGLGDPAVADVDGDGELEVIVPAGDATVSRVDKPGVEAPAAVWDDDGTTPAGSAEADLDETRQYTVLGADWPAVDGVDGYEARVVGPGAMEVAPWTDALEPRVRFEGLPLVPGLTYAVEVRAWRVDGAQRSRSAVVASDGVRVTDARAPQVQVTATPDPFVAAAGPLSVRVVATDDDRVAGLRLLVRGPDDAEVSVIFADPVGDAALDRAWEWNGLGLDGRLPPSGRYVVEATVTDRVDNEATARVEILLCGVEADPACPMAPDGGLAPDAGGPEPDGGGPEPDGGAEGDGGPVAADGGGEVAADPGGCECDSSGGAPGALVWLLSLALPLRRRRR